MFILCGENIGIKISVSCSWYFPGRLNIIIKKKMHVGFQIIYSQSFPYVIVTVYRAEMIELLHLAQKPRNRS